MAYLLGIVTPEERAQLEDLGWKLDEFGEEQYQELLQAKESTKDTDTQFMMAFTEGSMFDVMTGSEWEKGPGNDPGIER